MNIFLYTVLVILILFLNFVLTGFFYEFIHSGFGKVYFLLKSIVFLVGLAVLLKSFLHLIKAGSLSRYSKNLLTSVFSFCLILFVIEFVFVFIPVSNHTELTLASWTWEVYYNSDENELGYRDQDIEGRINNGKRKVFFMGDSYTEGFGLKKRESRFSDITSDKLGDEYEVFNFGRSGINTMEEFDSLRNIPFDPDIIVWQYFFNDINNLCFEIGELSLDLNIYKDLDLIGSWFVPRSYLLNYFYYKFYPLTGYKDYADFLINCASNAKVQQAYANQLDEVSDYCRSKNIKLIFLIIPNPMYPEDSQTADEFAVEYLNTLNIPVITVKDELMAIALEDRIVSPQDMHLSEESNRVVANLIWPAIMKLPKSQKITN